MGFFNSELLFLRAFFSIIFFRKIFACEYIELNISASSRTDPQRHTIYSLLKPAESRGFQLPNDTTCSRRYMIEDERGDDKKMYQIVETMLFLTGQMFRPEFTSEFCVLSIFGKLGVRAAELCSAFCANPDRS